MAERRQGLRWWELKAQSPSQMAVKGLSCTPLPIFWRPKPSHHCHLGGSPSQPVTSQSTFQVLQVLAHHFRFAKTPGASPKYPGLNCHPLRYLFRAKATLEAEGTPEAESCWAPESTLKHIPAYRTLVQLAFLCRHASQDASPAAAARASIPRSGI